MLRESLGLTDAGMRNFKRGVFFCALANLVLMAPLCVLFLLVAAFFFPQQYMVVSADGIRRQSRIPA